MKNVSELKLIMAGHDHDCPMRKEQEQELPPPLKNKNKVPSIWGAFLLCFFPCSHHTHDTTLVNKVQILLTQSVQLPTALTRSTVVVVTHINNVLVVIVDHFCASSSCGARVT